MPRSSAAFFLLPRICSSGGVIPAEVVGLDLDAEEDSPAYLESLAAQEGNEEATDEGKAVEDEALGPNQTHAKKRKTPLWRPWTPEKMWIAETLVEVGAQEHAARWNH